MCSDPEAQPAWDQPEGWRGSWWPRWLWSTQGWSDGRGSLGVLGIPTAPPAADVSPCRHSEGSPSNEHINNRLCSRRILLKIKKKQLQNTHTVPQLTLKKLIILIQISFQKLFFLSLQMKTRAPRNILLIVAIGLDCQGITHYILYSFLALFYSNLFYSILSTQWLI